MTTEPEFGFSCSAKSLRANIERIEGELKRFRGVEHSLADAARAVEQRVASLASAFERIRVLDPLQPIRERTQRDHDRIVRWVNGIDTATATIAAALPKRGWYVSSEFPVAEIASLAKQVNKEDWDAVDQLMLQHASRIRIEKAAAWLEENGAYQGLVARLRVFVRAHDKGAYEESTFVGVPLLDEVARFLFAKKPFTTKGRASSRESRPLIGYQSGEGNSLDDFSRRFVQTFGSLQEDVQEARLEDPNYWNRHAIVHGMARRPMNEKDSAKCVLGLAFLLLGADEKGSA